MTDAGLTPPPAGPEGPVSPRPDAESVVTQDAASDDTPDPASSPQTELRTFLIADIRGYTIYTRENGDEAAAALAERFAELVAEIVTAREGFLLELRGDEALVVFVSARKALRAAIDLQARFAEAQLPRGVGIGLDAGEAIPIKEGYRGTALNLAARLCAQAGPGEILASEAVIHLAAKVDGISYVDARMVRLKGYDEAVRAVAVVPSDKAKGRRLASSGRGGGRRSRWLAIAGAAAAVVAIIVAASAGGFLAGQGSASVTPVPSPSATAVASPSPSPGTFASAELPVLAFYDAKTGAFDGQLPVSAPTRVAVFAGDSFWQVKSEPPSVDRIDPQTLKVSHTYSIPVSQPLGFAFSKEALWFTDRRGPNVVRMDAGTEVVQSFPIGENADDRVLAGDIVVGGGSVWFSRPNASQIVRMDPTTGKILKRIKDVDAFTMDYGNGAVWYTANGKVGRIDPATNTGDPPIEVDPDGILTNMAFAGGFEWLSDSEQGVVYKLDRTKVVDTIPLAPGIYTPSATADSVWLSNSRDGTLTGIDALTNQKRTIDTRHATLSIATSDHVIMAAVGPTASDVLSQIPGDVLTLAVQDIPWFPSPDPPNSWDETVRQLEYVTCLQLVNYPDAPAPAGWDLAPEAAAAMPTVSPDSRTYTFTIRPGLQFSPPSNEPITAETYRASIERALSHELEDGAPGRWFLHDIVGAEAFSAGTVQTVAGLQADGDTLKITLVGPSPTFLQRLALPFYCPVPLGTPPAPEGLNPFTPVAGSGPYYLATQVRDRLMVFKKNPNYHGDRPQPFDAIAVHEQRTSKDYLPEIKAGTLDGAIVTGGDSVVGPGGAIDAAWGADSEAGKAGDQHWFGAPTTMTAFFALNPTRPAFKDPTIREAVALALDRSVLAAIWPRRPVAGLLPAGIAGVAAVPVPRPDLDLAKQLMAGRAVTVTLGAQPHGRCTVCDDVYAQVVSELAAIGVTVKVQESDDPWGDATSKGSTIDLLEAGTGSDIPDAGEFVGNMGWLTWLGTPALREIDRILTLSGQQRLAAANVLTATMTDSHIVIPYSSDVNADYFGGSIGCGIIQPAIGAVDLLTLCRTGSAQPSPGPSASP